MRTRILAVFAVAAALLSAGCDEDTIDPVFFGDLFGEVLDRDGAAAVEGVTLSTSPPSSIVVTDENGRFHLADLPAGTYSLRAEKPGYATQVASVTVFGDRDANVVIRLVRDSIDDVPPAAAALAAPADGAAGTARDVRLTWRAPGPEEDDPASVRYTVLLFGPGGDEPTVLAEGIADTSFVVRELDYGVRYGWQVVANDGRNAPTYGPVWGFRTAAFPDFRIHFAREREGVYDVYATDGAGDEVRLTDNGASNWRPRVSPRRDAIAFISNRGVQPQLYVMDRDGDNVRQVTTVPIAGADLLELDFAWSPDGARLLYPAGTQLLSVNADGTGLRVFAQAPSGFTFAECDWTTQGRGPDGAGFVVARLVGQRAYQSRLSLYDAGGRFERDVVADGPGATGGPRVSAAGTRLLYTQDAAGFEDIGGRQLDARAYEIDPATGVVTDRSGDKPAGTNDLDAVYSPDGSRVLVANANNDGLSRSDLYVITLDEEAERTLVVSDAVMPEWR